jgi:hypothetical protein
MLFWNLGISIKAAIKKELQLGVLSKVKIQGISLKRPIPVIPRKTAPPAEIP